MLIIAIINKSMKYILSCALSLSSFLSFCQSSELSLGEWKIYNSYYGGYSVTQASDKVYYASNQGILQVGKDQSIQKRIDRTSGLNNVNFGPIKYTPFKNTLIITYADGGIDLYRGDNDIRTLNEIANNQSLTGIKTLNDIVLLDESTALLCANFGYLILDLKKEEFKTTVFTPYVVNSAIVKDGSIYLATAQGVFFANLNANLQDLNNYTLLKVNGNVKPYECTAIANYRGGLYFTQNDTLWSQFNNNFNKEYFKNKFTFNYLTTEGTHLLGGQFCKETAFCGGQLVLVSPDGSLEVIGQSCFGRPYYAVEDQNNVVWVADEYNGFRKFFIPDRSCSFFEINSIKQPNAYDIAVGKEKVYFSAGGLCNGINACFNDRGIMVFDDQTDQFSQLNGDIYPNLKQFESNWDYLDVLVDPKNQHIYTASFLGGLIEFTGDTALIYNSNNSALQKAIEDPSRNRVGGMAFDKNGNLWISNNLAAEPIVVQYRNKTWRSFPALNSRNLLQMHVDDSNNKWVINGSTAGGLLVFNEGNDPSSGVDDKYREINNATANLPVNLVNCVQTDLNGDVWVGTGSGPVVFECGSDIFNSNCKASRRIISQDGFGAVLLETENIRCIAIDGANRKWFGTDNGIFVQSADGETQIYRFNTDNSPLPSNVVNNITFNNTNGETWISTALGICRYRMEATQGGNHTDCNLYAFPNPITPQYDGPIVITGLAVNSSVKITDTQGRLVYETNSTGGQATWNGQDYNGRKADSGVYLVFATSTENIENPEACTAKIVISR